MNKIESEPQEISLNKICRENNLGQSQYISRYLIPENFERRDQDYPYLGEGLRVYGDVFDYYEVSIHKDDVMEFVKRVLDYKTNIQKNTLWQ